MFLSSNFPNCYFQISLLPGTQIIYNTENTWVRSKELRVFIPLDVKRISSSSSSSRCSPRLRPETSSKIILRAVWYRVTDTPTKRRQLAVVMLSVFLNTAVRFSSLTIIFLDESQPFWKKHNVQIKFPYCHHEINLLSFLSVVYGIVVAMRDRKLPMRCNMLINVAIHIYTNRPMHSMECSQNHVVIKMAPVVLLTIVTFDRIIFTSKCHLE